jgi:hypothetical protein
VSNLARQTRQQLQSVYAPPAASAGWRLELLVDGPPVRYFSYGRHALAAALHAAGIGAGDTVLLPAFICREVLSAVYARGARPAYYAVDRVLGLAEDAVALPPARAIIAVDYFGFAQDLAPFRQYCTRNGAVLIEDNAHGLFSRDEAGVPLGTRGDLGIFSIRKTLAAPDGAALVFNKAGYTPSPQLAFDTAAPDATFRFKQRLRQLTRYTGPWPARGMTALARLARRWRTGHALPPSSPESEKQLPPRAAPSALLKNVMANTDVAAECARRRELYCLLPGLLDPARFPPLHAGLPAATVPYGYPFFADEESGAVAGRLLARHGLECFRWPALPDAIAPAAPAHYTSVWMVSFLW